jgi:integrase
METVPAGPTAARQAEKVRTKLLNQVDEQRNARTRATVDELMDRYLEVLDVDRTTRKTYEGYINRHIRPLLGTAQVGKLNGQGLDSFFLVLRTCRTHCNGRPFIEHDTDEDDHDCTDRCRPHTCRPLATSSIHQIRACLSGALKRAVRWGWITVNPLDQAEPPKGVTHNPDPPTAEQAAAIVNEAFRDPAWGMLVWLAMTTGARRGELCALRRDRVDLDNALISIRTSVAQDGAETWEKDTKNHQQRRIALDEATVSLLRAYLSRCDEQAVELGITVAPDARVFSPSPDHSTWVKPGTVSQRYERMCVRLGWDMHIHQLRHYSATELITAGVDARTVAGRLGHGGGGSITLRVYSAWVSEADQRAAGTLNGRMPAAPIDLEALATTGRTPDPESDDAAPYQRIAADLRGAINCGILKPGDHLPTINELRERYKVSAGTAHRGIALLISAGLVTASRGRRATVAQASRQ